MTRSLGPSLPPPLVERLAQRDPEARLGMALPFVTVDGHGRPHPMLLSYLELRAYDTRTVGLVIGARSRSAQNLAERPAGTLRVLASPARGPPPPAAPTPPNARSTPATPWRSSTLRQAPTPWAASARRVAPAVEAARAAGPRAPRRARPSPRPRSPARRAGASRAPSCRPVSWKRPAADRVAPRARCRRTPR